MSLKFLATKKCYSFKQYWAPSLWARMFGVVGGKRPQNSKIKTVPFKDDTRSNGKDTDTYYTSTRWSMISSGKAVQSKENGEFREENIYYREKNLGMLPWMVWLDMDWEKDSGPLNCFMIKGQLLKRYHRQRRQWGEKWEDGKHLWVLGDGNYGMIKWSLLV